MANNPKYNISPLLSGALFNGESVYIRIGAILSAESELSVDSYLITNGSATLSAESDLTVRAFKVVSASASLDGILDVSVSLPVTVAVAGAISISSSLNFIIPDLIRFTPTAQNPGSYIPLLLLDGVPLTDQNRKFNISHQPVFVEKKNWNASKSRYYKRSDSGRQSFRLSWEWLPSDKQYTIDKRQARNFIKDKAMDPDAHTLTVITYGENPEDVFEETEYNVFITNYTEDLVRRDLGTGTYFWKCDIEMEEL